MSEDAHGLSGVLLGMGAAPLSAWWSLPFLGLLVSIALLPQMAPKLWHRHDGKLTLAWSLALIVPFVASFGPAASAGAFAHVMLAEYIPFIVLLTSLFTAAGGVLVRGAMHGSPAFNTWLLLLGAVLASIVGTTGASMLLIRPLLRANQHRKARVHQVVFFIFIVSNIGGSLTPLGDPPLFLGFLQGVEFFWTTRHLLLHTALLVAALLVIFFIVDSYCCRSEGNAKPLVEATPAGSGSMPRGLSIEGSLNLALLATAVLLVLMSGVWKSADAFTLAGTSVAWSSLCRDLGLLAIIAVSIALTPASLRSDNGFTWAPMGEVARLFAGIFVTIVPVIAILQAGSSGAFAPVLALVTGADGAPLPGMYFWVTGLLSSFLDNAPTYLVFFNMAGGDAAVLMTTGAATLAAISAGAVFMGANSYIGNAPNLMVRGIAQQHGVRMPGFFGYMGWSIGILVPLFMLIGWIGFGSRGDT